MSGVELFVQAFLTLAFLCDPITRAIFFRALTANEPERRPEYVRKIMITVAITLGGAALVGKELLDLVGISLDAFGIAGGIVLALMGFQMLLGSGDDDGPLGGSEAGASAEDKILVPYAIPFMCGPGAITAAITIASSTSDWEGPIAALVAVALVVALIPVGHIFLINRINLSEQAMAMITRFGGLIVATIGIQLMLNGIKDFFG